MKFDIRPSPIDGLGVFALRPFEKGESCGVAFTFPHSLLSVGKGTVDREIERTMLGRYVNHDSLPNCVVHIVDKGEICDLEYVASRVVNIDDELTLDYRTMPWEGVRNF